MARAVRTLTQRSWLMSEAEDSRSWMLAVTRLSSSWEGAAASPHLEAETADVTCVIADQRHARMTQHQTAHISTASARPCWPLEPVAGS